MRELKPMSWPKPVPVLGWLWDAHGDYADIRERVLRTGRLDTLELWEANSGDSWNAFRNRHGDYNFEWDWRTIDARNREQLERAEARRAEEARRQELAWEAEKRRLQQVKREVSDHEWKAVEAAKTFWERVRPSYAHVAYRSLTPPRTGTADGVTLHGGETYWLPLPVYEAVQAVLQRVKETHDH